MAKGVSIKQISQVLGQAIKKGGTPQTIIAKEGIGQARQFATEQFGYDFVGLIVKLTIFFTVALVFAKFMEAVIFVRGGFVLLANVLGFQIPSAEQIPDSLKKLFNGGVGGFKFWDIVKLVAIALVVAEFVMYLSNQKNSGGKPSPMTIGIFVLIFSLLGITTVPELYKRIKGTDFNLEALR